MAYFIPTNDPDFVYPERYGLPKRKPQPKYYDLAGEPKFKVGDMVVVNKGIYMVRSVTKRTSKNGRGKGCYLYGIGTHSLVAENNVTPVTDQLLKELNLTRTRQ